jgi:hypothetical protein
MKQLAIDNEREYPEAANIIKNNSYVDDYIYGHGNEDVLLTRTEELFKITASAKLDLRKISSNSTKLMDAIPEHKREQVKNRVCKIRLLTVSNRKC